MTRSQTLRPLHMQAPVARTAGAAANVDVGGPLPSPNRGLRQLTRSSSAGRTFRATMWLSCTLAPPPVWSRDSRSRTLDPCAIGRPPAHQVLLPLRVRPDLSRRSSRSRAAPEGRPSPPRRRPSRSGRLGRSRQVESGRAKRPWYWYREGVLPYVRTRSTTNESEIPESPVNSGGLR